MCKVTCATFVSVNSFTWNKKNKILVPPYQQSNIKHWKSKDHMYIYIFIHVMDCFCTNTLYNFGSLSGTKLSEKYETIISNCQQCHVSLPSKAHVHSGHSERLEADGRKTKNKKPKKKKTFPSFLLGLLALEAVVIVVMVIKLQTPMKV